LAGFLKDFSGIAADSRIVAGTEFRRERMPKRDTLSLLDEYDKRGLDKDLFREPLHHLGAGFEGFYQFCLKVNAFIPSQCNQLLHDRLVFILDQIRNGAPSDRVGLKGLIEQSWIKVPCSRYPKCKGHKFDPNCRHRK
jgi:hypothetical protein